MSCATLPVRAASSSYRAMTLRQIFGAAHLLEAADRPLELKTAVAARIEAFRLGIGGSEQLHLMFVERVDQGDEARSLVAHFAAHHRNANDDHCVVPPRDCEIVGGTARLPAQPLERENRDAFEALGDVQGAPPADVDVFGRNLGAI